MVSNRINISFTWLFFFGILFGCRLTDAISSQILNSREITNEELVGLWVEDSEECELGLPDCSTIEFTEGGLITATNLQNEYFGYLNIGPNNFVFDATGEWTIDLSPDPLGNHTIDLHFDPVKDQSYPSYHATLYVQGKKGAFSLFAWSVEPYNRVTYRKDKDSSNTQ